MNKCQCCNKNDESFYMYRTKRGKPVFTGFVQKKDESIVWIGKNEKKKHRPIESEEDRVFFIREMRQYD